MEAVSRWVAVRRIAGLIATAEWRTRPRAWTEVVIHPGVIYGYSARRRDVCLLVRYRVLVTVLSRRYLAQTRRRPQARCG